MFARIIKSSVASIAATSTVYCDYDSKQMEKTKYTVLKGSEFKQRFPAYKPVKIVGANRNGFPYVLGTNKNTEAFMPAGECLGHGLYFTDESDLPLFVIMYYGNKVAHIKLLDEEDIWVEGNKCKTNQFEIVRIEPIEDYFSNLSVEKQIKAIQQDWAVIYYIKNPLEQVQLAAVQQNGYAIQYIQNENKNISEQVQLAAVQQNGHVIQFIIHKNKTVSEQVQLAAVKQNGDAIIHIKNPSEQVQLAAVKQNGDANSAY